MGGRRRTVPWRPAERNRRGGGQSGERFVSKERTDGFGQTRADQFLQRVQLGEAWELTTHASRPHHARRRVRGHANRLHTAARPVSPSLVVSR